MLDIKDNLYQICNEINRLAVQNNRKPEDIRLIAVSKTKPMEAILQAYAAGQRDFAENYLQEAEEKITLAKSLTQDLQWHFIGQMQSNKCKRIAENFDWVHSLAKLKHAQKLNNARPKNLPPLQICIQVSLESQVNRNGVLLKDARKLAIQIQELSRLELRGLMCVLPVGYIGSAAYNGFLLVKNCFDELQKEFSSLDNLSIGMSSDYPEAIRAGATMLRLGSVIFGERNYQNTTASNPNEN